MTDMATVRDLRFEGMDIPELLDWINKIKSGRGADSMEGAARSLEQAVGVIVELDETLRRELGKLRIEWEGNAGTIAQAASHQKQVVMQESQDPLKVSAKSVQAQGQGYSTAKNGLPNPGELQNKHSENFIEWAGGPFGYESDYDKQAKAVESQKKAAQDALNSYRDTTVTQADAFQPLPEMPPAAVTSQSVSTGGSTGLGGGFMSAGAGGGVGGGSFGGYSGDPYGGGSGSSGENVSGGGHSGSGSSGDEASTGGAPDRNPGDDPKEDGGIGLGGILGIGAGGAAVAGLGALAAGRMLGGKGGAADAPVRGGVPTAKGGSASVPKGGSSGIGGGPGDTTAGRTASTSATSRPGPGSMMGPAATRGGQSNGEEDEEHENKYVLAETHFDDNRLVAPPVLGESAGESADDAKQS